MTPITTSIEIARSGEQVFAYVTDPSSFPEWQLGVVSGHLDTPTTRVGSKCTTIRRIGGREREVGAPGRLGTSGARVLPLIDQERGWAPGSRPTAPKPMRSRHER